MLLWTLKCIYQFKLVFFPDLHPEVQWVSHMVAQMVKNLPAVQETRFNSWIRKICWRRDRLPTQVFLGSPCDSAVKESSCHVGDLCLIPGLGWSHEEGKSYPLQYSGLENSQRVQQDWATFTLRICLMIECFKNI